MKKLKMFLVLTLISTGLFFNSCKDEEPPVEQISKERNPVTYEWVGKLHNEGLDHIYDGLKEAFTGKDTSEFQPKDVMIKMAQLSEEYLNNLDISPDELGISKASASLIFQKTLPLIDNEEITEEQFINSIISNGGLSHGGSSTIIMDNFLKELLEKLKELLQGSPTIPDLTKEIDHLNQLAEEQIEDITILINFYATSSVAKHSYIYWEENAMEWAGIFGIEENDDTIVLFSAKDYVSADAAGAAVGGVKGAAGGPAAAGAGALGGALLGSGGMAVKKLVDAIWSWF